MDSENDEEGAVPYKTKYRQLKNRLKYLIYEHECFETDIQKAQMKLLQLSRDKNFLLDQLMRYEAVVLSGGEETDYSSGEEAAPHPPLSLPDREKTETSVKSETMDQSVPVSSSARATASTGKPSAAIRGEGGGGGGGGGGGAKNTTTILHTTVVANSAPKTASLTVKSGGVKKTTKTSSTKVSAMAAAKITKAVARARQAPQQNSSTVIVSTSPLIVSLPLGTAAAGGGWGKPQPQATPQATPIVKHTPQILSLSSGVTTQSTTAAILASIPVPAKPPRPKPLITTSAGSRPAGGKGLSTAPSVGGAKGAGPRGGVSSSSSSSSSSDSEDSASDSSSSGSSHGEEEEEEGAAMDTGGPVPIVHSVPVPAGAPQLLRPKAIVSPVKAPPPKLIPMGEQSSVVGGSAPSPLATPTGGGATRFLWSNRVSVQSGGEATPTMGFVSIAPLMSPTSLTKPSSGSAFQLVTSPPGSAPLARPPSLQDEGGVEPGKPHPPP